MSDESFNWHTFLGRWQEEWVPRADHEEEDDDEDKVVSPGSPGASEAEIAAAEKRLGLRLPPSYRQFLAVSDGWHVDQTAGVYQLGGVADIDWSRDPYDLTALYTENLDDDPREEDVLLAGMWARSLRLETDSDMTLALLDPGDRDDDGEWALYIYKGWSGELPDRYPSFRALMEAMYRSFHADRVERPDFDNATTRAQDARVETARLLALRGRYEDAVPLLEEASSFGRPHSYWLLSQIRHLQAPRSAQDYGFLVADPRYLAELLPVHALEVASGAWRLGGDDHWLGMMAARGVDREAAEDLLHTMREGTHRYAPPGEWGRAVAEARESARWGATDAAWRVLRKALVHWEAPGPQLIAPLGLLADPILASLITPERGREILATPRAGEQGPLPEPVPDLDPPGLAWLTTDGPYGRPFDGYRCIWVEGVDPSTMPALIGEEGAELSTPVEAHKAYRRMRQNHERDGVELWEDRAEAAVGRTAEGWAFAFDGQSGRSMNPRFESLAPTASASGRAVVVWRAPLSRSEDSHPAAFHLSVADRGQELCAFTVRGADIQVSGSIPDALRPARLLGAQGTQLDFETRVLEAMHSELGLSLPCFALTRGSLPMCTTRSWTRAPREGEGFAYLSFRRSRS
ncbi:cell wall assembly protein [Streptomyces longisporoflavus]|uniref:SMI1/KNR4 family protein n=1 Tax=Streptomyces longisporoflavus TaxID=28044 RepID=UPI00167CED1B|nr:SMI1/KNR4 family protein [Streptomyces longisporoflavus]GGV63877.1 cell wall assembly protein [Streptomyces longisporoflavus]